MQSGKWRVEQLGKGWSHVRALRVIGRDCQFAIEDRCSKKGHRKKAIVIGGWSNCQRKHLGLSTKCLGRVFKLAT